MVQSVPFDSYGMVVKMCFDHFWTVGWINAKN